MPIQDTNTRQQSYHRKTHQAIRPPPVFSRQIPTTGFHARHGGGPGPGGGFPDRAPEASPGVRQVMTKSQKSFGMVLGAAKKFSDITSLLPRGEAGLGQFTEHATMVATKSDATVNRAKV